MSAATPIDARRILETRLIEKAWKDPEFRKNVIQDPKGMFEGHLGQKLPAQLKIVIHEEDANTLHFSIPPSPSAVSELSDEDLEKVAGGTEFFLVAGIVGLAVAAGTAVGSVAGVTKTSGGW